MAQTFDFGIVLGAGIEPARAVKARRILSPVRLPVPPSELDTQTAEATNRVELLMELLQSSALPLGYVADVKVKRK